MQVTKGTWRMREQCLPGSLSSSPAQEPGNEAILHHVTHQPNISLSFKVSLYLRLQVELGIGTRNTTNIWNEEVLKTIAHLPMDSRIVAEVKKGLEFGRQVNLPPILAFSPQLLANLFANKRHVKPLQHLR